MVAYKLYWRDEQEEDHFIGILPERRKDPARITKESITNWAREAWGQNVEGEDISFIKIMLDDSEKVISGYLPTND